MPRQAFSIRLNPQEKSRYQSLAQSRGISLGEWTREAMMKQAERQEYPIEEWTPKLTYGEYQEFLGRMQDWARHTEHAQSFDSETVTSQDEMEDTKS